MKASLFTERMARKAREAFLPHRDLNASISIARRAMSSAGWESSDPPNQQMRFEAKSTS
jgi:transposase